MFHSHWSEELTRKGNVQTIHKRHEPRSTDVPPHWPPYLVDWTEHRTGFHLECSANEIRSGVLWWNWEFGVLAKKNRTLEVGTILLIITVLLPYILYIIIHKIWYSTAFGRVQMIPKTRYFESLYLIIFHIFSFSRRNIFEHLVLKYRGIIPPTFPSRLNLSLGAYFPKKGPSRIIRGC